MLIRREQTKDERAIAAVHGEAFAAADGPGAAEARLVDLLRNKVWVRRVDPGGGAHTQGFDTNDEAVPKPGTAFSVAYDPRHPSAPAYLAGHADEVDAGHLVLAPGVVYGVPLVAQLLCWVARRARRRWTARLPARPMTAVAWSANYPRGNRADDLFRLVGPSTWLRLSPPDATAATPRAAVWQRVMWNPAFEGEAVWGPVTVRAGDRRDCPPAGHSGGAG